MQRFGCGAVASVRLWRWARRPPRVPKFRRIRRRRDASVAILFLAALTPPFQNVTCGTESRPRTPSRAADEMVAADDIPLPRRNFLKRLLVRDPRHRRRSPVLTRFRPTTLGSRLGNLHRKVPADHLQRYPFFVYEFVYAMRKFVALMMQGYPLCGFKSKRK